MGIAHHSNYLVWFEIGRTDLCRLTGFSYERIESMGYILVVTDMKCRFVKPFLYDEEVLIRTSIASHGSRSLEFAYELSDAEGNARASGSTSHLWLDRATRKPVRADAEVMRAFGPWLPERDRS